MTTARLHTCTSEPAHLCHSGTERKLPTAFAQTVHTKLRRWRERARGRRQLTQLDYRALRDIGITDLQARDEWQKPFWRP